MQEIGPLRLAMRALAAGAVVAAFGTATTTTASAQHASSRQRATDVNRQAMPSVLPSERGSLSGTVVTPAGRPAAGTCVTASPLRLSASAGAPANAVRLTTSGRLGRYFFTGLTAGRYRLRFEACPTNDMSSRPRLGFTINPTMPTRLESVVPGALRPVARVVLPAAPIVVGRDGRPTLSFLFGRPVTLESAIGHIGIGGSAGDPGAGSISGRVTDSNGSPISGICAVAATLTGRAVESPTSTSGIYELIGLPAGGYEVGFAAGCGNDGNWIAARSGDASVVEVHAGRSTRDIDGRLASGSSISGAVTNAEGRALRQVCVTAVTEVGSSTFVYAMFGLGPRGTYEFSSLVPGPYTVSFVGCGEQSLAPQWWDDQSQYQKAAVIHISAAKAATGINAVMTTGGSITGVVASASGTGLAGICAMATTQLSQSLSFTVTYASVAGGRYSIPSLGTGTYDPQYAAGCPNGGNYAPTTARHAVKVVAGKPTRGVDVTMTPGATISGNVSSAAGDGLRGVCVEVGSVTGLSFIEPVATRRTGDYSVDQLPVGGYQVEFVPGCPTVANYITQYYDDQTSPSEADTIKLAAGATASGIDAVLQPGGTISGTVTTPSGAPVLGACVVVSPVGQGFVGDEVFGLVFAYGIQAGVTGKYTIVGLPTDSYAVFVDPTCGGETQSSSAAVYYGGGTSYPPTRLVSVTAGQPTADVDVTLTTGGSIAGTVDVPGGSGCLYLLSPSGTLRQQILLEPSPQETYGLEGLLPGRYLMAVSSCSVDATTAPEFYPSSQTLAGARPITVRANETTTGIDFNVPKTAEITGHVTAPGGRPATVCISADDESDPNAVDDTIGISNRAGNYALSGLGTGTYVLAFGACGRDANAAVVLSRRVSVTDGAVVSGVDATLVTAGVVTGEVRSRAGTPLGGVCVLAAGAPGGVGSTETETLTNGSYDLSGVSPGEVTLEFSPTCGIDGTWSSSKVGPFKVASGKPTPGVDAKLAAGGSISGTVTGPGSDPAHDVCVLAVPAATGEPTVVGTTARDGTYSIVGVLRGRYDVEFTNGCGNPTSFVTQWWEDAGSQADATPVLVPTGSVASGIDARLSVAPSS
jgi:hypothetical protein